MRRFILVSLILFVFSQAESYALFDFGLRGGLNYSSISSPRELVLPSGDNFGSITALDDTHRGFHFGVYTRFSFLGFFVQPELLYTQTGQKMLYNLDTPLPGDVGELGFTQTNRYLDIPVTAGMKLAIFRFGAGPVFSILLDQSGEKLSGIDFEFNQKDTTVGYQLMAGLQLRSINLDFIYRGNLSGIGESVQLAGQELGFDTKPSQYIISLGIKIF